MFDRIGLFVSDFEKGLQLYEACFEPLGIKIYQRQPQFEAVFSQVSGIFRCSGSEQLQKKVNIMGQS